MIKSLISIGRTENQTYEFSQQRISNSFACKTLVTLSLSQNLMLILKSIYLDTWIRKVANEMLQENNFMDSFLSDDSTFDSVCKQNKMFYHLLMIIKNIFPYLVHNIHCILRMLSNFGCSTTSATIFG